jgi:hypothetical protein
MGRLGLPQASGHREISNKFKTKNTAVREDLGEGGRFRLILLLDGDRFTG